ncbi:class I SAM-dependent methyltransferase [Anaerobacillus sp. MEB173]|uniref:class I SAM-dependent methyltransferase n=1 Tax=Anaerobacillus sp. MEB173 TaxID=3383345 RepID=UPI003F8FE396
MKKIKKRYDRVSRIYDVMDRMVKEKWRKELLQDLHGNVLEVGIGTGANLTFYPGEITLTGIDFSPGMLEYARKKGDNTNLPFQLHLIEMDIQSMDFSDNSFDYVIATCVNCSVPDPIQGLKEMRRVCKPDGKILLIDHVRSENEIVGILMDLLNPLTVKLWGANINRRTTANIESAGLIIEENEPLYSTIIRRLTVHPNKI